MLNTNPIPTKEAPTVPKIVEKQVVLNGRGTVVLYGSGTSSGSFFYRELVKGKRAYRQKKIEGAETMEQAIEAATEVAFQLQKEEPSPWIQEIFTTSGDGTSVKPQARVTKTILRKPKHQLIEDAVTAFLKLEQKRVDVGLLKAKTKQQKAITLTQHLLPYLKSKRIHYTIQIKEFTFKEYEIFRAEATPLTRNSEITQIKDFCKNYLVKHRLIEADLLMSRDFLARGKVKQVDRMRNPAISPEDWELITKYTRGHYRETSELLQNHRIHYWRTLFWHFILFAKNSGMSPEEILKLEWRQIEIIDEGRINSKGERESWEVAYVFTIRSKTKQAREIPVNQARELRKWKMLQEEYLLSHSLNLSITRNTLVFGNPHNEFKAYGYSNYQRSWSDIRASLASKFKGHRFSKHHYTIYSLRSTFIEDHLLKGTPVYEVAEMAGHSVIETQKTYARLNLRKKGMEITMPKPSDETKGRKVIDLFLEEKSINKTHDH